MTEDLSIKPRDNREKSPDWTCESCILNRDWVNRSCYERGMCRYYPEILLIESHLLKPIDVKIGEWNPEYDLNDGTKIRLFNKKRVSSCYKEVKEELKDRETHQ